MTRLRLGALLLLCVVLPAGEPHRPLVASDDTVLWHGNSLVERLLEHGGCEALVQLATPGGVRFRSLAWTGDEVGHRLRPEGYVDHLRSLLEAWPAQVVVVGFGMNESFAGAAGVASSAPRWKSSFWIRRSSGARRSETTRASATPSCELSSSTVPQTATRDESLRTRSPVARAVVPSSPVLV